MKKKIFLYYSVLILVCLLITGVFTFYLARHFYTVEVEKRLMNLYDTIWSTKNSIVKTWILTELQNPMPRL